VRSRRALALTMTVALLLVTVAAILLASSSVQRRPPMNRRMQRETFAQIAPAALRPAPANTSIPPDLQQALDQSLKRLQLSPRRAPTLPGVPNGTQRRPEARTRA